MKYLIPIFLLISHTAAAQLSGRYVTNDKIAAIHGQWEIRLYSDGTAKYYVPVTSTVVIETGKYTLSSDTVFLTLEYPNSSDSSTIYFSTDTLVRSRRQLTSLSGEKYYKRRPRRELNDLLR